MADTKKPSQGNSSPDSSDRDYSKEIGSIPLLRTPSDDTAPLRRVAQELKTPVVQKEEESLTDVLFFLFFQTSRGRLLLTFVILPLSLWILAALVPLAIFGSRTVFVVILCAALFREYMLCKKQGENFYTHLNILLLVPTLVFAYYELSFLYKQHEATEITREISGNPSAWAECQRFLPALFADSLSAGFYAPSDDPNRAVIQYIYCNNWGDFLNSDKNSISDMQSLWALGTVIHEAIHVSGELNEAVTQCLTLKAFPHMLKRYGVSENKIKEYSAQYAQGSLRMPSNYLRGECEKHPLISKRPSIFGP